MITPFEAIETKASITEVLAFQERFIRDIPPGTVVWKDAQQQKYGTTVDSTLIRGVKIGIYDNPRYQGVWVTKINSHPDTWDLWKAKEVVRKT